MHTARPRHRLPRAGVDPVDPRSARAMFDLTISEPLRHETIVMLLDHARRGLAIVVVSDTVQPDAVLDVAELVVSAPAHEGRVGSLVIASVRPGVGATDGDVDRWLEMTDAAERAGVELLDWMVFDENGISYPRDLLGEPPRW